MRWDVFDETQLSSEETVLTTAAHALMTQYAQDLRLRDMARSGPELRIVPEDRPPYVVSVWGQAQSHGRQGAHPARIAALRELEYADGEPLPVLFLAVQGDVGWATWMVPGHEPEVVNIDHGSGGLRRQGWRCGDMINIGFTMDALERASAHPRRAWRWPEEAPSPNTERSLF